MGSRSRAPAALSVVLAAAVLLAVHNGTRSAWGLFLGPINSAAAFGAGATSLAIALGALAWGAAQPAIGATVQRLGAVRVLLIGGVSAAALTAAVPLAQDALQFTAAVALAGLAAAAAGSAPLLMGIVSQHVSAARRGTALGVVSAGGSLGQLLLAPATVLLLGIGGWKFALLMFALMMLVVTPLALLLGGRPNEPAREAHSPRTVRQALASSDYWLISAGFFVCGFHVSLLSTHMPGVIELCGLPASFSGLWLAVVGACNIAGSIGIGVLMRRYAMKSLLATLYTLRALGIVILLVAPPGAVSLLIFALWMGMTFMATLPPTIGLIAQLFGARQVALLFGLTMAIHQVGSFFGAWLGGLELEFAGKLQWVWALDIGLAAAAALIHLPVRERPQSSSPALAAARG